MDLLPHIDMQEFAQDLTYATQFDLFDPTKFQEEESWKTKHPEEWTSEDIIDWIYSVANPLDMELNTVCGESFQNVSGQQLCQFSVDEFLERDRINGTQLYNCLQELLRQSQFFPPSDFIDLDDSLEDIENLCCIEDHHTNDLERLESIVQPIPSFSVFLDPLNELPFEELSVSPYSDDSFCSQIPAFLGCYSVDDVQNCALADSGYESSGSFSDNSNRSSSSVCASPMHELPVKQFFQNSTQPRNDPTTQTHTHGPRSGLQKPNDQVVIGGQENHPPKRKPGRPPKRTLLSSSLSSSSSSSSDESYLSTAPKKSKKKNTHLWKFMRALLEDPAYNPNSIKWENKREGVFRIVPGQSKFIAKLWGQRKNNPSMTFDKMSRSLRWCRTYGFLSEVPKDGNYPKKLCFRFGDRAANWQM